MSEMFDENSERRLYFHESFSSYNLPSTEARDSSSLKSKVKEENNLNGKPESPKTISSLKKNSGDEEALPFTSGNLAPSNCTSENKTIELNKIIETKQTSSKSSYTYEMQVNPMMLDNVYQNQSTDKPDKPFFSHIDYSEDWSFKNPQNLNSSPNINYHIIKNCTTYINDIKESPRSDYLNINNPNTGKRNDDDHSPSILSNDERSILGIKRKRKKKDSQTKLDTNLAFFDTLPFSKLKQESLRNRIKNVLKKKPFLDIKQNQNIYNDPYLFNENLLGEIKSKSSNNECNILEPNLSNSFDIDYNNCQNLNSSQRLRKSNNFPLFEEVDKDFFIGSNFNNFDRDMDEYKTPNTGKLCFINEIKRENNNLLEIKHKIDSKRKSFKIDYKQYNGDCLQPESDQDIPNESYNIKRININSKNIKDNNIENNPLPNILTKEEKDRNKFISKILEFSNKNKFKFKLDQREFGKQLEHINNKNIEKVNLNNGFLKNHKDLIGPALNFEDNIYSFLDKRIINLKKAIFDYALILINLLIKEKTNQLVKVLYDSTAKRITADINKKLLGSKLSAIFCYCQDIQDISHYELGYNSKTIEYIEKNKENESEANFILSLTLKEFINDLFIKDKKNGLISYLKEVNDEMKKTFEKIKNEKNKIFENNFIKQKLESMIIIDKTLCINIEEYFNSKNTREKKTSN